jgi:hypothetical protein
MNFTNNIIFVVAQSLSKKLYTTYPAHSSNNLFWINFSYKKIVHSIKKKWVG